MMLPKLSILLAAAMAVFAQPPSCSTAIQCCETLQSATLPDVLQILTLLGLDIPLGTPGIGLTCTALEVLEGLGETCDGSTVCCDNTATDGSIAVGCVNTIV